MPDANKYFEIYQEIEKLSPEDTIDLVLEAKTQEEKNFYGAIGDYLLQKKQRDSIKRNVF